MLQALHGLSLAQTSYLVQDRLSWMRFCGLGPGDPVPDKNTLWDFRETLIAAGALERLFERLNVAIARAGYLAMGGRIVDARIVEAPKQRHAKEEKADIKAGRVPKAWRDKPHKLRQKDRNARWTCKRGRVRVDEDGREREGLRIPAFGYKSHVRIDRRHGLIRRLKFGG